MITILIGMQTFCMSIVESDSGRLVLICLRLEYLALQCWTQPISQWTTAKSY